MSEQKEKESKSVDASPPEGEEKENSEKSKAQAGASQKPEKVIMRGGIEIFPDSPLPNYSVGANKAYSASVKNEPNAGFIAIVCEKNTVPRVMDAKAYSKIINPNVAKLVSHGSVHWPPADQERYVFVYFDNLGMPFIKPDEPMAMGWKADFVLDKVVRPMVNVLMDFKDKDFVHGNIRPSNFFGMTEQGSVKSMLLGDGLSAPAGYHQPIVFETVERSMADPIARGVGTQADDLYAFGVSLAVMLRHNDPLKGMSDEEIIYHKLEHGSYSTVTGKDRFRGEILELLRGLLHDDHTQRWGTDEMLVWLDGRRLTPKQALVRPKAPRPLDFMGKKFIYMPHLAMSLRDNPSEVKRIVDDDSLIQWLKRSVEDEPAMLRTEKAIMNAKEGGTGKGYEDRLTSNISAALDTYAPIRFHRRSMSGNGVGAALAQDFVLKQDTKYFSVLLASSIIPNWVGFHENTSVDVNGLFTKYERCRRYIKNKKLGDGVERALYTLCADAPCLSDILDRYVVVSPSDLLHAFEDMCAKGQVPPTFLDRHSVAYLMEKDPKSVENCLYELNSGDKAKVVLGNLRCIAALKSRCDVKSLPALTKALAGKLPSVYETYHDRRVRDKLKISVKEFAAKGQLEKIAELLDNASLQGKDEKGFNMAVKEYDALRAEAKDLATRLEDKDSFGIKTGREWAAVISSGLAIIVIVGTAMMMLGGS